MHPELFCLEVLGWDPDPWQAEVLNAPDERILLNCARQSGKSETVAKKIYHNARFVDGSLSLIFSPSLRQSSLIYRKVVQTYGLDFTAGPLVEDSQTRMVLQNGSIIENLPATEKTTRGFSGASLIVFDEASEVSDELYFAMRPVLAVSRGKLILLSTPKGKRGFFFSEWTRDGKEDPELWRAVKDRWKRFQITADGCPRITKEFLEEERERLPLEWFLQEYYCKFLNIEGQVFSYDLVKQAFTDDIKPFFKETAISGEVRPMFAGGEGA